VDLAEKVQNKATSWEKCFFVCGIFAQILADFAQMAP
jgi:hypothetical protein